VRSIDRGITSTMYKESTIMVRPMWQKMVVRSSVVGAGIAALGFGVWAIETHTRACFYVAVTVALFVAWRQWRRS